MDLKWIFVAAILGFTGALPAKYNVDQLMRILETRELGRNNAIENVIINIAEDFRQTMLTGSDSVPVLDPLRVDRIYLDDSDIPIPGARVELNNLVVSQLSTFELPVVRVTSTSIILQQYEAEFRGGVPVIDVDVGAFDIYMDLWGAQIFGKGDAKIQIVEPWLKIDTNVNLRVGVLALYLNLTDLRLDFGLTDIQFNINGMFNDPSVDDFVNRFLRNLILEFAEFWVDEISDVISPIVQDYVNDILADINLIDFLG